MSDMVYTGNPKNRQMHNGRPYERLKRWLKLAGTNICWICGTPIDLTLYYNHRDAWTLDHVLPVSKYPEYRLCEWNAREAHRKCNSARGNKGGASQGVGATRSW